MGRQAAGRSVGGHRAVRSHADHREAGAGGGAHEIIPGAHGGADAARHHGGARGSAELAAFPTWDPHMVATVCNWVRPIRQAYFRSEIAGLDRIVDEPSMLVGNHDGGYVFPDAICLGSFYYDYFGTGGRRLYALMHDFPFRIAPTLTEWLQRCGVPPSAPRNGDRVLATGHHLLL